MSIVFISHSSQDKPFVANLQGLMEAVGHTCWVDEHRIAPSDDWEQSLQRGLRSADWVVVVVSAHSATSEWVKRETTWALENLRDRVIPVVVDGTRLDALHPDLSKVQSVDFGADRDRATHALVKMLVASLYHGRTRHLGGTWWSAIQPVYYVGPRWHVHRVEATEAPDGYTFVTVPQAGKLQWRFDGAFTGNDFLTGPWRSTRPGSQSHGVMTLQIARNGTYLCGHDYGVIVDHSKANFGIMLFARDTQGLDTAWHAVSAAVRPMQPLTETLEFPNHGAAS